METLRWIGLVFAIFFGVYSMMDLYRNGDNPTHYKVLMTLLIVVLPVVGALIYFRQKDIIRREERALNSRRKR